MGRSRAGEIVKRVMGITIVIAGFYFSWNGGYFGLKLLEKHFNWSLTPYKSQLLTMMLQFLILFLLAGIAGLVGRLRGDERAFYIPIITAMRQISKGNFKVELENDRRYGQFGSIVEGINEMASELSRMETMRQDFISNVSHEIQSPLTSIRGFARALRDEGLSAESRAHYLDIIEAEGSRLSGLSDNLLKLSALEAESFPFERTAYRLDKQLQEMILACEPQWLDKNIDVEAELEEVTVQAVKDLLSQVWTNLLHNSIKFTPQDGMITVRLRTLDNRVEVEIKDNGIGIAEDDLPRIFERFYKVDKARSTSGGGSGLGLSLVKKIVDIHEGSITITSRPGEGTACVVVLPMQP
ncbi:sensor histidine kinase [Paenibacillus riograndensis]|uniref:histidine kinase n=1 Tax=Paenibacillus riograndensis SBR5 TaxID=1073571 RepID=A0A0E4HE12_9BACL|nr:HAMP domain-containing sensor histidine kinase [Paenibacillus riograndensis]CQR58704.1 ATPase/histidine kinase/DNA gyrase B/HSP90 domain protein [Paenibacillus riograndensis SBR5]